MRYCSLAHTGSDVWVPLVVGGVLVAAGLAVFLWSRRGNARRGTAVSALLIAGLLVAALTPLSAPQPASAATACSRTSASQHQGAGAGSSGGSASGGGNSASGGGNSGTAGGSPSATPTATPPAHSGGGAQTPQITSVSPVSGPVAGGQTVTIQGHNLAGATEVQFGSAPGIDLHAVSDTKLTVTTTADTPQTVEVRVTTPSGNSSAAAAGRYTYALPAASATSSYTPAPGTATVAVGDVTAASGGGTTGTDAQPSQAPTILTLAPGAAAPAVGAGYYLPPGGTVLPGGLAGVVASVAHGPSGTLLVTVAPAPLDQVMTDADVHFSGPVGGPPVSPAPVGATPPHRLALRAFDSAAGTSSAIGLGAVDGSFLDCTGGVTLTGTVNLSLQDVRADVDASVGAFATNPHADGYLSFKAVATAGLTAAGNTTCTLNPDWTDTHELNVALGPTGLLLSLGPRVTFQVGAFGSVTASEASTHTLGFNTSLTGGTHFLSQNSASPLKVMASGKLSESAFAGVQLELSWLHTVGVGADAGIHENGTATVATQPAQVCIGIAADLRAGLYADLNLWFAHWTKNSKNLTLPLASTHACVPLFDTPPVITSTSLTDGVVDTPYKQQLTTLYNRSGTWGVTPDVLTGTGLPAGLTLSGDAITGTPTSEGQYAFTLTFTDTHGESTSIPAAINIVPAGGTTPPVAVSVPDPYLHSLIDYALGMKPGDPITPADAASLTTLSYKFDIYDPPPVEGFEIKSLAGLQNFTNLTSLTLENTGISDLSPLADLTKLTTIDLSNIPTGYAGDITDIAPLSGLTNLTSLDLSNNKISDIEPLAGLTNLTTLDLSQNWAFPTTDTSVLTRLTNLTSLNLAYDPVTSYSPFAVLTQLTYLNLAGTQETDLSLAPLAKLVHLTHLELGGVNPSFATSVDLSPLSGLSNLTYLAVTEEPEFSNIAPIAGFTKLTYLFLDDDAITNITPLAGLKDLVDLDLQNQNVTSLPDTTATTGLPNPVVSTSGAPVPLTDTAAGPGFAYDASTNTWSVTAPGTYYPRWSQSVTIGGETAVFSGTLTQTVTR